MVIFTRARPAQARFGPQARAVLISSASDSVVYVTYPSTPGVYFIVELVKSKQHPRGVRVARYIGEIQDVRTETKRQRICRIVGGCEGKVRFFAIYTGKAKRIDRREVEWALHQRFVPTISTARRRRRAKR